VPHVTILVDVTAATTARPTEISDALEEVRAIVQAGLRGTGASVYLFGSRARGESHRGSDIDVAVLSPRPLPVGQLAEIRDALAESTVPYAVDLVDLADTDEAFRARVLAEGIPWTD
jgi:predicted nucleotidyltransferase